MTHHKLAQRFRPIKVVDIELSRTLSTIEDLTDYEMLQGLVRLHGAPIGYIHVPIHHGRCTASTMYQAILEKHSWPILRQLVLNGMFDVMPEKGLDIATLLESSPTPFQGPYPLITVAVCTRDRSKDLARCLDALQQIDYPKLDILIIDNAPSDHSTETLIEKRYSQVRYIRENRPGLSWARNRALLEAKGEIIAFTDDDVIVDPGWITAIAQTFTENPEVMALTGLVVPYELETVSQKLFEIQGGFGRGFSRKWFRIAMEDAEPTAFNHRGAGQFGTGANMAFRRRLFETIDPFDPALGVGTATNGGEDLEMFYRLLKEGHLLVYEPNALVRHRHRRDYPQLKTQITNNGIALMSYWIRSSTMHPKERLPFTKLAIRWFLFRNIKRLLAAMTRPMYFPRELILAEFKGYFIGLRRYQKAKRGAENIEKNFGPLNVTPSPSYVSQRQPSVQKDRASLANCR